MRRLTGGSSICVRRIAALAFAVGVGLVAHPATAQGERSAAARELFDQGRALMDRGEYTEACKKFEDSLQLSPGGGTVLNLALCHERSGRTASAWAEYRSAIGMAARDGRADRQSFAEEHLAALSPHLSRLRVVVASNARIPGLVIERNGTPLGESAWGEALAVDPGQHVIEARAPMRKPLRLVVEVRADGDSEEIVVPPLDDARTPSAPLAGPPSSSSRAYDHRQRVYGALVAGVGAVALAAGTFFGIRAVVRKNEANDLCPNYERCDPEGLALSRSAVTDSWAATGLITGGVALAGTGALLFFTAAPAAGAGSARAGGAKSFGLSWAGRF
jgi:hypothetical protein